MAVMAADMAKGRRGGTDRRGRRGRVWPQAWPPWWDMSTRCGSDFTAAKAWPPLAVCSACCRPGRRRSPLAAFGMTVARTRFVSLGSVVATILLPAGRVGHARAARGRHRRDVRRAADPVSTSRQHRALAVPYRTRPWHMTQTIGVLGSGSWGSALAVHLARTGHDVRLWARDAGLAATMAALRENPAYLPGLPFPPELMPTASLADAITRRRDHRDGGPVAWPARGRAGRRAADAGRRHARQRREGTRRRDAAPHVRSAPGRAAGVGAIVVLSGPSFAIELARELPTAMVAAGDSTTAVEMVQAHFRSSALRLYGSADVVGVEIGGALKNTIAIAAGVVEGLGLGHNALAALITRGLAELSRLAVGLGAQRETLSGLAGLGDLVLTCTGDLSRNRQVGIALGRGQIAARDSVAHEDGRRRREDHRSGTGARRAAWHRAADCARDVGSRGARPQDAIAMMGRRNGTR